MIAVALVGAGEAVATRLSTGDTSVDEAAELMINLFWRGLKGVPTDRDAAETAHRIRLVADTPTHTVIRRNVDFLCAVVIVGLLAGVAGLSTTLLLRFVEHLTYHYTFGSMLEGVTGSSPVRRALGPMVGGALAGLGWWILRSRADIPPVSAAIARHERIRLLPFGIDAALQVVLVGSGASLGREGAPRQLAAALGDFVMGSLKRLSARDREIPTCVCGRRRTRCGVRGAGGWRAVHSPHHAEIVASAGAGRRADHLEPGRRRRLSGHSRSSRA